MPTCQHCGKRGLFLRLSANMMCTSCVQAMAEQQLAQQHELETSIYLDQQLAHENANIFYKKLVDLYGLSFPDVSFCSLQDVTHAVSKVDSFISTLEEIPSFKEFPSVFADNCSYLCSTFCINEVFGYISLSSNYEVDFSPLREKARTEKVLYQTIISCVSLFKETLSSIPQVEIIPILDAPQIKRDLATLDLKTSNITARTSQSTINEFFVVDVETTGLNPVLNEIIQLTAIRFVGGFPISTFSTYVKPRAGLNPRAYEVNRIDNDMVAHAPYIESVIDSFSSYVGDSAPIVGHNITFDYNFLCASGYTGYWRMRKCFDTLELSKREFSYYSKFNLDYLCRRVLNIIRDDAHDSLSDALATGMLFHEICRRRILI